MATALYRRYRPESFAEVIGQDHVTEPLRRALSSGRVGHAYLFSGPRGCGKTTSARILARCLNCAEGPTPTPCGTCESCVELARGGSGALDVVEIDAASHGGVDDARELRERAAFAPVRDRYKVFIIDEAHMVTSAGFNALLKLVEEPPEHVKFIFATTEPDKVIGTIRSRTHHYPFRLIPPQILLPYLEEICREENVAVADGVLSLAVRSGGGSARDTLSVVDQLIAGSDERGVELDVATNLLGFTNIELLNRAVDAIAARDAASLFGAIDEVVGSGHEPRRFVEDLLERFRDLIVLAAAPDQAAELLPDVPADQVERLAGQSQDLQPREMTECADIVSATLNSMVGATSPRLHLELLAAKLVLRSDPSATPNVAGGQGVAPTAHAPARPSNGAHSAEAGSDGLTPRQRAMQAARQNVAAARQRQQSEQGADNPTPAAAQDAAPASETLPTPSASEHPAPAQSVPAQSAPAPHTSESPRPEASDWATAALGDLAPAPAQGTPQQQPVQSASQQGAQTPREEQQAPAPAPELTPESAVAPTTAGANRGGSAEEVEQHWSAIMDSLQTIRRPSWALIAQNAGVHSFDGSQLVLQFRSPGLVTAFYRGTAQSNMAQAVKTIMHIDVTVEATSGGELPPQHGGQGSAPSQGSQSCTTPAHNSGSPSAPVAPAQPGGAGTHVPTGPGAAATPAQNPASNDGWATVPIPTPESQQSNDKTDAAAPARVPSAAQGTARKESTGAARWGDALADSHSNTPETAQAAPAHGAPATAQNSTSHDGPPDDWFDQEPPPEDPYEPHDPYMPAMQGGQENAASSEPARHEAPSVARTQSPSAHESSSHTGQETPAQVAPRGNVSAVSLPPQPDETQPRTHGQMELMGAMRRAYAHTGFEPADSLITKGGNDSAASAQAETAAATPHRASDHGAPYGSAPDAAAPAQEAPLSGAALARKAFRDAQKSHAPRRGEAQTAPAAAPMPDDDPYGGASLDDEDATGVGNKRRPGRDIVEEFLGGELLEVIDETKNNAGY